MCFTVFLAKHLSTNPLELLNNLLHSLIIYIYTNDTKHAIVSGISIFDLSDHLPTFSIIKTADINTTSNNYTVGNMKNFCINDFLFDLYQQLSQSIHHNENSTVNSQFETFVDIFQTVVNNHAPLCNASRKQKRMRRKPWLTPGIYKSILTKIKCTIKSIIKRIPPYTICIRYIEIISQE